MKKNLSFLLVPVLLLGLFPSFAYADIVGPAPGTGAPAFRGILIAVAVIVVAFVLWRILRKKK